MQRRLAWLARQFARPQGLAGRLFIGPWLDRISAASNRLALAELCLELDDDLLEIGFGGGALLAAAAPRCRRLAGVDPSIAMVRRARRRLGSRAEIVLGSAEELPFGDAAFDKTVSVNNIYFWSDPAAVAAELARVLRPGGRVAIVFEPPEELRRWPGHRFGFRLWSEEEARDLLEAAGFVPVRTAWGSGRKPDRFLCLTATRRGGEADGDGRLS